MSGAAPEFPAVALTSGDGSSEALRREVEAFLYLEAQLLDEWQIEAWLDLFTDDCIYWLPSNTSDQDPETETSIIHDDYGHLADRVHRLLMPMVHAQTPRSRTMRQVTNIRLGTVAGNEVQVFCNLLLHEVRLDRQRFLSGPCEYRLRRMDGRWRIQLKKVALLTNDLAIIPISILV